MNQLTGGSGELLWVGLKALLLYTTAIAGFRLGERRTLAEMSAFDFVAAVAVGAIVGRVPNSTTTSFAEGAVTLLTVLIAHWIISRLRYVPGVASLVDHPPRLLVSDGRILEDELRRSGLTHDDLYGLLRQHGVAALDELQAVVFEQRGKVSVMRKGQGEGAAPELMNDIYERTDRGRRARN